MERTAESSREESRARRDSYLRSACRARPEGRGGGGAMPGSGRDPIGDTIVGDLGSDEPQVEAGQSPTESPWRTKNESEVETQNGSQGVGNSARQEGSNDANQGAVDIDEMELDDEFSTPDGYSPNVIAQEQSATNSSTDAVGRVPLDARAVVASTTPPDLGDEDLHRPKTFPETRNTTTLAGAGTSDPGAVDHRQAENAPRKPNERDRSATEGRRQVLAPRQARPPEDAHEYTVKVEDVSVVDRGYASWNYALVEQLLLAGPTSGEALLCVNSRVLARVSEQAGLGSRTPEEAERQFTASVSHFYRRRVLGHSARLRALRRCSSDGSPDCVAFLAGSVLAAFRMQSDWELSGSAYYRRLADLLECEMHGGHPRGFDPLVFESLWVYLATWLLKTHGRRLAMPKGDVGFRRFVALPLAHAPLRSMDIEKLSTFFCWAGYPPGARARPDRILTDLKRWQRSKNILTPIGADALSDGRSSAVAAQVGTVLEAWDGSLYEATGKRRALVEIQFDVVQRSPVFSYLPRRPSGFPRLFDDGERVFEASDEGWYDPEQLLPTDGRLLQDGFEWNSHDSRIDYTMWRPGASVIPFAPSSSYSGFLSSRRLLRGVKCSVLCRDNIVPIVKDYLNEVAQRPMIPVSDPRLPNGWSMFRDVSARVAMGPPAGLEALEVDEDIRLVVEGGLRIGRSWSWIMGAPPRLVVSGVEAHERVTVNGAPVEVDVNGRLLGGGIFDEPGDYLIEVGRLRRRITMEQPQVSVHRQADLRKPPEADQQKTIALPVGSWTLIGNSPIQVTYRHGAFFRGTIASCPFHPIWAIKVGAGPGALVAATGDPSPLIRLSVRSLKGRALTLAEQWSNVVYSAHIRRPQFVGLNGTVPDEAIGRIWAEYVSLAKAIKRSLKKLR
ncbi:MAG: hypothetical protein F4Y88_01425 [Chloroflexi bacterium]|nr:hypothetical protein [Chloroflexota bacterium]